MAAVSIITPSFNRADLYPETFQSLQQQTFQDWENIVVDDGSTDECLQSMKQLTENEPRVKISSRKRNPKGACACRNIGVENCTGKYVIFLDTDDLLEPHCLQQRIDVMEQNPELDLAFFPCKVFEKQPGDLGLWWNVETDRTLLERQFHQDAIAQGTGVIWKKSSFQKIGMWGEHLAIWQDIDMFLRTFIQDYKYKVCFDLPADLLYRQHNSLSRHGFYTRPKVASRCQVIKDSVELLDANDKSELRHMARFMVAETVYGAARGKQYDLASELLTWALHKKVVTTSEAKILNRSIQACKLKVIRFATVRKWIEGSMQAFHSESQLCRVADSEPLIQNSVA